MTGRRCAATTLTGARCRREGRWKINSQPVEYCTQHRTVGVQQATEPGLGWAHNLVTDEILHGLPPSRRRTRHRGSLPADAAAIIRELDTTDNPADFWQRPVHALIKQWRTVATSPHGQLPPAIRDALARAHTRLRRTA